MQTEGEYLKQWIKDHNSTPTKLARSIGVRPEAVFFQFKKEIVSDSFKHKLTKANVSVFTLSTQSSTPSEPSDDIQYGKTDQKQDMERDNKALRQRIADLEDGIRQRDKIISLYEQKTPAQGETVPGSKTKAG